MAFWHRARSDECFLQLLISGLTAVSLLNSEIGVLKCHATRGHRKTTIFPSLFHGFDGLIRTNINPSVYKQNLVTSWLGKVREFQRARQSLTTVILNRSLWHLVCSRDDVRPSVVIYTIFTLSDGKCEREGFPVNDVLKSKKGKSSAPSSDGALACPSKQWPLRPSPKLA